MACPAPTCTLRALCLLRNTRGEGHVEIELGDLVEQNGKQGIYDYVNPVFLQTTTVGDTILLILGLCFHWMFEGIGIGVSDTKADAWRNLWTILAQDICSDCHGHSAPEDAAQETVPADSGLLLCLCSLQPGRCWDWVCHRRNYPGFNGISMRVFIYVAINHLIAKGFKPQGDCRFDTPFFEFLAVLLGVVVIAVVMIWD
ncbi:hypothetical protein MLD38_008358 [Melastoma candidum]|uniref:Uncharacterized protein n=1 Tax=Melastoma candidum TaxID=119954 RepID=A0ACB9RYC4_9MYRT|nr:hypothetical protein MLD38_008358 [Melastoma candidum]